MTTSTRRAGDRWCSASNVLLTAMATTAVAWLSSVSAAAADWPSVGTISTYAGTGFGGYNGDAMPATSAHLNSPAGTALDGAGNLFIADWYNHRIRRVAANTGEITTVAGTGAPGFSGDGGPATEARLQYPSGVAVTPAGDLLIADWDNHRIRKVAISSGVITTVAGNGTPGFGGDGGLATNAKLYRPFAVAVNSSGTLFIADQYNHRVRMVDSGSGTITTVAGTGTPGSDSNILATASALWFPNGVAVDPAGTLYISDRYNHRVRKITAGSGFISTVVGTGTAGSAGEGGPATSAQLSYPAGLSTDASGNLYIADQYNNRVVKLTTSTGLLATVAGSAVGGFAGDGSEATAAQLSSPLSVTVDATGALLIADYLNNRIRKVGSPVATHVINSFAGTGQAGSDGDGPALTSRLYYPNAVAIDASGNVYIADQYNHLIRRVEIATGRMTTVAGTGVSGFTGDGGPATAARLYLPADVAVDGAGNIYICDQYNHRIRKVTAATGVITTLAGTGSAGYFGDGLLAVSARLAYPSGVAVDAAGNIYIADQSNHRIRKVTIGTDIMSTVAGTGTSGYAGDGGAATSAQLFYPNAVTVDPGGNLLIADLYNHRVRKVTASTGLISTVAGTGTQGFSGDAGPATAARLNYPNDVALDRSGNLYIADINNHRIRKVSAATGAITTVTGNGNASPAFTGEGSAATAAALYYPRGVEVDASGNVYVVGDNHRVLKATDPANTIAPSRLTAVRAGLSTVTLNWTASPGATSYVVKRATSSGAETPLVSGITSTSASAAGIVGVPNYFVVTAIYGSRESGNSNEVVVGMPSTAARSDADGDNRSDIIVYRPSTGEWFIRKSSANYSTAAAGWFQWGQSGYIPLEADFDGDGKLDPTVWFNPTATWYIRYSSLGYSTTAGFSGFSFGAPGVTPIARDFDGDGKTDIAYYSPTTGTWTTRHSSTGFSQGLSLSWGLTYGVPDVPKPGDFDGDGKTDVAVYRPSTGEWFIRYSSAGYDPSVGGYFQWGGANDSPLAADFDGDGRTDIAAYRPTTGEWFIRYSSAGYDPSVGGYFQWGLTGDVPRLADFDGDGKTDITVFRPSSGEWFIRYSSAGYDPSQGGYFQWGLTFDIPLPQ